MLCIGVNKIKIHFDTSQLCCGVVHYDRPFFLEMAWNHSGFDLFIELEVPLTWKTFPFDT
jgi:hypothetical protein